MGFIETPIGWALLGLMAIGSPALGYIALRTIFSNAGKWVVWKRLLGACVLGAGWIIATLAILFPASTSNISILHVGEFFALAGMGFILLVGIASIFTRGAHSLLERAPMMRAMDETPMRTNATPFARKQSNTTAPREPSFGDVELQDDNAFAEKLSSNGKEKPARARSVFVPSSAAQEDPSFSGSWEPSMQDGLGLLKEEALPPTKARAGKEKESKTPIPSSLDAQLEQLKKDIKAFNASASKGSTLHHEQ